MGQLLLQSISYQVNILPIQILKDFINKKFNQLINSLPQLTGIYQIL
jgi:hypothetical protein